MRSTEMIFMDELNWENLLTFAGQFLGLVTVARWSGNTPEEKTVLTVAAVILYTTYLLLSIIRTRHKERLSLFEETHTMYIEQIEETKKATVAYRDVNEKLTQMQRKHDDEVTKRKAAMESLDVYKGLVGSSKKSIDETRVQIQDVTGQRDGLLAKLENVTSAFDELKTHHETVKDRLDGLQRHNGSVEILKEEIKSLKASQSRLIGEVRKYNAGYVHRSEK